MAEGIRGIHRQYSNYTLPSTVKNSVDEPSSYIQPFDITHNVLSNNNHSNKLILLNFQHETDPTRLRQKLWNNICKNTSNTFADCFGKPPGVDISSLPTVYRRNRHYPLWLSPRGNGIDCHRTWEALYLDAIPIVWHSTLDPLYADLPIIVINDSSEVNEQFLRKKLHEIIFRKAQHSPVYRYEKLRNAFWRDMILKKSRHSSTSTHIRRNQCWRATTTLRKNGLKNAV